MQLGAPHGTLTIVSFHCRALHHHCIEPIRGQVSPWENILLPPSDELLPAACERSNKYAASSSSPSEFPCRRQHLSEDIGSCKEGSSGYPCSCLQSLGSHSGQAEIYMSPSHTASIQFPGAYMFYKLWAICMGYASLAEAGERVLNAYFLLDL